MRLRVEDLIAPVASCHTQSNFKIRDMAARALAPLIALPAVAPFLISLLESLPTDLNAIHGRMAQLRYLAAAACKYSTVIEGTCIISKFCILIVLYRHLCKSGATSHDIFASSPPPRAACCSDVLRGLRLHCNSNHRHLCDDIVFPFSSSLTRLNSSHYS